MTASPVVFPLPDGPRRAWRAVAPHRAEAVLLVAMALSLGLILLLAQGSGRPVGWSSIGRYLVAGTFLIGLAGYARARSPRLAACAFAVGAFVNLGNLVGTLLLLRFPLGGPTLDRALEGLDAHLGYSWPAAVTWAAANPPVGPLLALIYESALAQVVGLLAFLALTGREAELRRFQLGLALGLMATAAIWWVAPSLGPAVLHAIPEATARAVGLVVGEAYRAQLLHLAAEGAEVIATDRVTGVIAFPSYHMAMAVLVTWSARGTRLAWPLVLVNLAMIPAAAIQGAHHASDLAGGLAVTVLAILAARRLVP